MIVYAEDPETISPTSQIVEGRVENYPTISDEYFEHFGSATSLDEIKERLLSMDACGTHLANDDGVVYRSAKLAEIVGMLQETAHPALFTTLTRQYGLRKAVLELLKKEMMK